MFKLQKPFPSYLVFHQGLVHYQNSDCSMVEAWNHGYIYIYIHGWVKNIWRYYFKKSIGVFLIPWQISPQNDCLPAVYASLCSTSGQYDMDYKMFFSYKNKCCMLRLWMGLYKWKKGLTLRMLWVKYKVLGTIWEKQFNCEGFILAWTCHIWLIILKFGWS